MDIIEVDTYIDIYIYTDIDIEVDIDMDNVCTDIYI